MLPRIVDVTGEVEIEYSVNAGITWQGIGIADVATGQLQWKIPGTLTGQGLLRVITKDMLTSDVSDAMFTIVAKQLGAISVVSPNGGEVWKENEMHAIQWQTPQDVATVDLAYSVDAGATWISIVEVPAASAQYQWVIPRIADTTITSVMVKVTDVAIPGRFAVSSSVFTFIPIPPQISNVEQDRTVCQHGTLSSKVAATPNPAYGQTELQWEEPSLHDMRIRMYNMQSVVVEELRVSNGTTSAHLNVSELPDGIYYVVIADELTNKIHAHGSLVVISKR